MCDTFFQEEIDQKSMIRLSWTKLLDVSEIVQDELRKVQGKCKKQLTRNVKVLGVSSGLLSAVAVATPLEAFLCRMRTPLRLNIGARHLTFLHSDMVMTRSPALEN